METKIWKKSQNYALLSLHIYIFNWLFKSSWCGNWKESAFYCFSIETYYRVIRFAWILATALTLLFQSIIQIKHSIMRISRYVVNTWKLEMQTYNPKRAFSIKLFYIRIINTIDSCYEYNNSAILITFVILDVNA